MIPLPLTAGDWRSYRVALTQPNRTRIRVSALDLDGNATSDLTPYFDGGQVDVDQTSDTTRSLLLTLHDPHRSLPFDTDHPADTALYFDRAISVVHQTLVDGVWRSCPMFTGPVTKLDRDGSLVTVEAQGKERLFLGASWHVLTLHKGMRKTDAIRRILTEANPVYAETRLDIPDLPAQLPKPVPLHRVAVPWLVAQHLAHSMGMQLFYDGRGKCRLRRWPDHAPFTFTGEHHVITAPQISYSDAVVNAVSVVGADPKGPKTRITAEAVAPANHPLSPQRIRRYLLPGGQLTTDDTLKTVAEAQTRADRLLHDGLLQGVDVSFDSIPLPFLDPGDLCRVVTSDATVTFRLQKFSFPLSVDQAPPMTVGYHKNVDARRAHRRRNRR